MPPEADARGSARLLSCVDHVVRDAVWQLSDEGRCGGTLVPRLRSSTRDPGRHLHSGDDGSANRRASSSSGDSRSRMDAILAQLQRPVGNRGRGRVSGLPLYLCYQV